MKSFKLNNKYTKIFLLSLACFALGFHIKTYLKHDSNNNYNNNYRYALPINNNHLVVSSYLAYPIIVDRRDGIVAQSILYSGGWEPHISSVLTKLVKKGDTVVEVGANYGYHTILLGKLVGDKGHIYTYEANPDVCNQILYKNIILNDLTNNVHINCIAVSDEEKEVKFLTGYSNLGGSFVIGKNVNIDSLTTKIPELKDWTTKTVNTTYLDKDLNKLKNIDILRMDAEGSELPIINGAKNLIQSSKHIKIIMEWSVEMLANFGNVQELLDNLETQSFKFYQIQYNATVVKISKKDMMTLPHCDVIITRDKL